MREFNWIRHYFAPLCTDTGVSAQLQDDTASLTLAKDEELVITTDTLIESVHFFENTSPELIASKALRVNLSDIAASGARPAYYNLALSVTDNIDEDWIKRFTQSLHQEQEIFGISLIGGDTTKTKGPLSLTITMFGICKTGKKLTRTGARVGDTIYVTGSIGESLMGLHAIQNQLINDEHRNVIDRYETPQPRINFARELPDTATACMDVSDGLAQDLEHLCIASKVGGTIHADSIPLAKPTSKLALSVEELISGGDDYELLFTAHPDAHNTLMQWAQLHDVVITPIGNITENRAVTFLLKDGAELKLEQKGYQHL